MESKLLYVLAGWIAVNAAVATALLNRRPRPHLRRRLFRWVVGNRPSARQQRLTQAVTDGRPR
jgi:hypothetical protein